MQTLTIEFDEFPDDSVEVIISPVPMADLFAIIDKARGLHMNAESFTDLFTAFTPYVVAWTWPEAPDAEGMLARDYNLMLAIVYAWIAGVRDVPLPLPRPSSELTPSMEE